jgi:hypothetical protein
MLYTTLNLMKKSGTIRQDYERFLKYKGGAGFGLDTTIPMTEILDFTNSDNDAFENALWVLRSCTEPEISKKISIKFALSCAEHVEHYFNKRYPEDNRVHDCNVTLGRYLSGKATVEEVKAASVAAMAAANPAARDSYPNVADPIWVAAAAAADASYGATKDNAEAGWAAWATSRVVTDSPIGESEKKWQIAKFRELLAK